MSGIRHSAGIDNQNTRRPDRPGDETRAGDEQASGFHRRERIIPEDRVRERREQEERSGVRMEERDVVVDDPSLSSETNAALTDELRDVVGADHVKVPVDRPHATRGEFPTKQSSGVALITSNKLQFLGSLAAVAVFGAVIALTSGVWWLLPVAVAVHAVGTMGVVLTIVRLTTTVEHPSAETAAALSDDGVHNVDERFTQMVAEFSIKDRGGDTETVAPGRNERVTNARDDTATAAGEQSTAITPTAEPSRSGGSGGAPDLIINITAFSLLVLSIVLPITSGGGWLWLLPAVMVPLLFGFVLMERLMARREDGDASAGRSTMLLAGGLTGGAIVVLCVVVAIAFSS